MRRIALAKLSIATSGSPSHTLTQALNRHASERFGVIERGRLPPPKCYGLRRPHLQRRKPDVDLQTSWRGSRVVELIRSARVGPGSDPGTWLLCFLLSQCKLPEQGARQPLYRSELPPHSRGASLVKRRNCRHGTKAHLPIRVLTTALMRNDCGRERPSAAWSSSGLTGK